METNNENTEQHEHASEDFFGDLKSAAIKHFSNKLELTKLTAIEKGARIAGLLASLVVIGIVLFFFMGYATFLLGLYLSDVLGSYFYGFGSVSIFLLIVLVIVFSFRKPWIEIPVSNLIVKILFDHEYEDEDTGHADAAERA